MTVALQEKDYNGAVAQKLRDTGHTVMLDDGTIERSKRRNLLIIDPMPPCNNPGEDRDKTRNNINTNIIALADQDNGDTILCPTLWNLEIQCDETTAVIHIPDGEFEAIQKGDFDMVVGAGASADHVAYDNFKNLPKLGEVYRWAAENTGGLLTICWSFMYALKVFHDVDKHVDRDADGNIRKIIGHFKHAVTNVIANDNKDRYAHYRAALEQIKTLPIGCTGYLNDADLRELELKGKISVLSVTPEKTDIADSSSIAVAMDNTLPIAYWGPHPDYLQNYVIGEVARDRDPETAQPGVVIPAVIGEDRVGPDHDWFAGGSQFMRIFMEESFHRKAIKREKIQSVEPESERPQLQIAAQQ